MCMTKIVPRNALACLLVPTEFFNKTGKEWNLRKPKKRGSFYETVALPLSYIGLNSNGQTRLSV
jgi:hypothetical protein